MTVLSATASSKNPWYEPPTFEVLGHLDEITEFGGRQVPFDGSGASLPPTFRALNDQTISSLVCGCG